MLRCRQNSGQSHKQYIKLINSSSVVIFDHRPLQSWRQIKGPIQGDINSNREFEENWC